ncbi:MAG: hypothetical protein PHY10_03750, partial [Patescibacteria group bacterium]|nr:hypothetical protein [Patescibacteria group bacterium]
FDIKPRNGGAKAHHVCILGHPGTIDEASSRARDRIAEAKSADSCVTSAIIEESNGRGWQPIANITGV